MGIRENLHIQSSIQDLKTLQLWRAAAAECLGTFLLVFTGCASTLIKRELEEKVVAISLCFGLSVATVVWAIAHVSGGHINPAVTLALLLGRRITFARAFVYLLSQLFGATTGAFILYLLVPIPSEGTGVTQPGSGVTITQAVFIEMIITIVLVFTVLATRDPSRVGFNGSGPLSIGLSVSMCHLGFIPYTGASMNTARSFGPALVYNNFVHHWIYWVGPLFGGAIASLSYEFLFAADVSTEKTKFLFHSPTFDHFDPLNYAEDSIEHQLHCSLTDELRELRDRGGATEEAVFIKEGAIFKRKLSEGRVQ